MTTYYIHKDPFTARSFFPSNGETGSEEGLARLEPSLVKEDGVAYNPAFPAVEARVRALLATLRKPRLRLNLVGLGDVGGTLLTALKLLSGAGADAPIDPEGAGADARIGPETDPPVIDEIGVYDPNEALCRRYELELNQVLGRATPRIVLRPPEALFDCDVFLFTASRGVPHVGATGDLRMAQFEKNRELLKPYAAQARAARFSGLFCQISDPVDLLARCVFLQSNREENGEYDFFGLLPEQVVGFGLGVMQARAADMARRMGVSCPNLRAYGPHGADLVVANDPRDYDEALSEALTRRTVGANLLVRELGFKPYIAPALSSAALSLLALLRGEPFLGAVPLDGVYFGCRSRLTDRGFEPLREPLHPALRARLAAARNKLKEAEPQCRM